MAVALSKLQECVEAAISAVVSRILGPQQAQQAKQGAQADEVWNTGSLGPVQEESERGQTPLMKRRSADQAKRKLTSASVEK